MSSYLRLTDEIYPKIFIQLHLDKSSRTFTMDIERLPDELSPEDSRFREIREEYGNDYDAMYDPTFAALMEDCVAKYPNAREITEEDNGILRNDCYNCDDMTVYEDWKAQNGLDFIRRHYYIIAEDEISCEALAFFIHQDVEWIPENINFFAYNGILYERIDKKREVIEKYIEIFGDSRLGKAEQQLLEHLNQREANYDEWMERRRRAVSRNAGFILKDDNGNSIPISQRRLTDVTNKLNELLYKSMQEDSFPDSKFTVSCDFDKDLTSEFHTFEGTIEEWQSAMEHMKVADPFEDESKMESEDAGEIFKKYTEEVNRLFDESYERLKEMNQKQREDQLLKLSEAYVSYIES